jgi:signal transduction histidine kinase
LGLGLSVAKGFIEMHGGRVEASSEVGRGSTFTVTLPGSIVDAQETCASGEASG